MRVSTCAALVLLFTMSAPFSSEAVEITFHLVTHGDLGHLGGAGEEGGPEHACSPLLHACGCHRDLASLSAMAASDLALIPPARSYRPWPLPGPARDPDPPLDRPPSA